MSKKLDDPAGNEVTVVTVCIAKHYEYIGQQIELIERLNPDVKWRLVVIDNATTGTPNFVKDDHRCTIVSGVPIDNTKPANCRGSYHHAAALNRAIKTIRTRFLVVLDPDLFVVYRNWIRDAIQHMVRNDLSFFGVPWHPRWYTKYRYFPCVHFLVIDSHRVDLLQLDFMPAIVERPPLAYRAYRMLKDNEKLERSAADNWSSTSGLKMKLVRAFSYFVYNRLWLISSRQRIHSSRDTGWKLWDEFGRRRKHRATIVLPVVNLRAEIHKPKHLKTTWGLVLERLLPARYSFLPARGTYVLPKHAPGFDSYEFDCIKPEMFVWRGAPFAFHLRRHVRDTVSQETRDPDAERSHLKAQLVAIRSVACWFVWQRDAKQSSRTVK